MNQPVLENNRRRSHSNGLDQAPETMRNGSLPARWRFELVRLAQRKSYSKKGRLLDTFEPWMRAFSRVRFIPVQTSVPDKGLTPKPGTTHRTH